MKKIFFVLINLLVVGVLFHSCRKSYDPGNWNVEPTKFLVDEYTGPTKALKIMSINMNLGTTPANFATMVNVIKAYDPDLLFLRQCDSKTTRANGVDRPQEIADELELNLFFKGRSYGGGQFGNAVLSKFPITETLGLDLTKDPSRGEQRMLAMIKVEVEDGHFLYFAGTELETNADDRRVQAIDILRVTQDLEDPVIFVGNFNEQQRAPGQALIYIEGSFTFACPGTGCAFNSPKTNPANTLDYITYQDPKDLLIVDKYLEAFKVPESANNFFPTFAEFRLKLEE